MTRSFVGRTTAGLALLAGLAGLAGCSQSVGSVTGTVTVGGVPVPGAQVSFLHSDGNVSTAIADQNGTYRMEIVPCGTAQVSVYNASTADVATPGEVLKIQGRNPAKAKGRSAAPAGPVPPRYGDPATSGLSVTVKSGENKYDIPLTP